MVSFLLSFSLHRTQSVQPQVIPPPQQPQQQLQHRVSTSLSLCMLWSRCILSSLIANHECYFPDLWTAGKDKLLYICAMTSPQTGTTLVNIHIVVQMFPTQTLDSYKMAGVDLIQNLPTAQAPSQMYHQQPQHPSTQLQPKAQSTTKRATKALLIVDPDTNKPLDLEQLQELPTRQCLTNSLSSKVIKNYIQYVMQQMMQILGTCSSVVSQSCNNCTCLGHFTSLQLYIHVHTFTLSRVLL